MSDSNPTTGIVEPQVVLTPRPVFGFHNLDDDKCLELIEKLKEMGLEKDFHIEYIEGDGYV